MNFTFQEFEPSSKISHSCYEKFHLSAYFRFTKFLKYCFRFSWHEIRAYHPKTQNEILLLGTPRGYFKDLFVYLLCHKIRILSFLSKNATDCLISSWMQ